MPPPNPLRSGNPCAGLSAERLLMAQPFPSWICCMDTMEVRAANSAAYRYLGCRDGSLLGHRLVDPVPEQTALGSVQPWHLRRCDGSLIRTAVVPTSVECEPALLLVTMVPSSSESLRRSDDDLLRDAKRESLELLAGGVAHDFNNLLTALLGNLSLARMDSQGDSSVHEWLDEAEKAAARARDLTHQLLTFAKGASRYAG